MPTMAQDLVQRMLALNPEARISAQDAVEHAFFRSDFELKKVLNDPSKYASRSVKHFNILNNAWTSDCHASNWILPTHLAREL
jgi:serine/threonine protein kinase